MEIRVYDRDLDLKGIIENQTSLIWTRKYNDTGTFEMHVPMTPSNMALIQMENLISFKGANEAGIIEDIRLYATTRVYEIVCLGRFLDSYLDRRVIIGTVNYSGTIEGAMRQLMSEATPLPYFQLGEEKGFTEEVQFQATYKGLLDYEQRLAKAGAYGIKCIPDFTAKTITVDIYKGIDRSHAQTERSYVEFSDRYGNLHQAEYKENSQLYKNVAFIGGAGEGSERVITEAGNTSATGYDRREMFVDARDLSPEGITAEAYVENLKTRGRDKLNLQIYSKAFSSKIISAGNFNYKTDYDLGDIVSIQRADWGVANDMRITEVTEIYEHEVSEIEIIFGSPLPEKIDWEE